MSQGTTKGVPIDVDSNMTANSDQLVPSQKAVKTRVDSLTGSISTLTTDVSGKLTASNNLSDLPSASTSRTNLGLSIGVDIGKGDSSFYRKTGATTLELWYSSAITAFTATAIALGRNQLRAIPFVVSKNCTLDRIAMEITVAGTLLSVVRLGIYDSVNGIPTNLSLDAGTIAGDSATFQSITINKTLSAGLYWLVMLHNSVANITFRSIPAADMPSINGVPSALGTGLTSTAITSTFTYAALPSTFDLTGVAAATSASQGIISVRLSA